jgi:hypothetical protein
MLIDFSLKRGDTADSLTFEAEYADGTPVNADFAGAEVFFSMMTDAGVILIDKGVGDVFDLTTNLLGYEWQPGDTAVLSPPGKPHLAEVLVVYADGTQQTFPNAPIPGGSARPFIQIFINEDIPGDDA